MIAHVLAGVLSILFVSPYQTLTLKFYDQIEYFSVGKKGDYHRYLSKDQKILVLTPLKTKQQDDLVVIVNGEVYSFLLVQHPQRHRVVQVEKGKVLKRDIYKILKKTKDWTLFEGSYSLKLVKKNKSILVNTQADIKDELYLSKGLPLFINQKQEY